VDIAPSAYQYRSDRKPAANPPESWIAVKHAAHFPLNQPIDPANPEVKRVLVGLLWEEIRPIQTLQLSWEASTHSRPPENRLSICALVRRNASSSWWNNLDPVVEPVTPTVSQDRLTYTYSLGENACGLVVMVDGQAPASTFAVPEVQVLTPDRWKKMDVEVEWGFDAATARKDFSGHLDAYDGRVNDLTALDGSATAGPAAWSSPLKATGRRGVKFSLLYAGVAKWHRRLSFTTRDEEVARTIVTVWTKSGSFSFLAADLENGPIYAPEYGFFVRRTSRLSPEEEAAPLHVTPSLMTTPMNSIAGTPDLKGWGSDDTPWFGRNVTDHEIAPLGIHIPAGAVAMHPGSTRDVAVEWRSTVSQQVRVAGSLTHAQAGSTGIDWWIAQDSNGGRKILGQGSTTGSGRYAFDRPAQVKKGDRLLLIIGPKGDHRCDTTIVNFHVLGDRQQFSLGQDAKGAPQLSNPLPGTEGSQWRFCSELPMFRAAEEPSEPPLNLASDARSGTEFEAELKSRHLTTIREMARDHPEQTWRGAVVAMRGTDLPPVPATPAGAEPTMEVDVPSQELNAQWKLGVWHLIRHCAVNPKTGKKWFNDFPYGILAAETYLVLSVLDQMGAHEAAADGFDQWLSLPLDREHPVGLFSDGRGAMTFAEGPPGFGGNMDGIHAFGPGSIGWALTQHYAMTGDKAWLRRNESRLLANAEWMLRQRQVIRDSVPGGDQLWGNGLQPALQVTPDSGGLWMQFYECEAYYCTSVLRLAETLKAVDPSAAAKLGREAEAYRQDLRATVDRSITLSPVVPVRDGTYHSVVPFACYVRGMATNAWGWQREGSGNHVGPMYWDTVQNAAALISPAEILSPSDPRVQGFLDVLEDRYLLENPYVNGRNWFEAGWQYQGGLERTANMHLAADDIPVFLRTFFNDYAIDILPKDGYVFNEHAVHGPPDKIFEEAAFLERFRNLLVMEDGNHLWLARGTPRAWLEQGKRIIVGNAPTSFGNIWYEIDSDASDGTILAKVVPPERSPTTRIWLRLRHPTGKRIRSVFVNGKPWKDFDSTLEVIKLPRFGGKMWIDAHY